MTAPKNQTAKKAITTFALRWIFLLIFIEIFSLFSLWSINKIVTIENQKTQQLSYLSESIWNANASFKSQIQSWKNILIRGKNKDDFKKYNLAFKKNYKDVQSILQTAITNCNYEKDLFDCSTLVNLKDEHFKLKDKYLNALATIKNYKINDFIDLDRKVRGIDRVLQENFLNTATELRTIFQNQQRVFNLSVSERYSNIKFFLLTLLLIALSYIFISLYKILKIDLNPQK